MTMRERCLPPRLVVVEVIRRTCIRMNFLCLCLNQLKVTQTLRSILFVEMNVLVGRELLLYSALYCMLLYLTFETAHLGRIFPFSSLLNICVGQTGPFSDLFYFCIVKPFYFVYETLNATRYLRTISGTHKSRAAEFCTVAHIVLGPWNRSCFMSYSWSLELLRWILNFLENMWTPILRYRDYGEPLK